MPTPLTERQNEALEFVREHIREQRKPPTFAEIGRALGIRSTNAVSKLVRALVDKGHLAHTPHVAHGISLADTDPLAAGNSAAPLLLVLGRVSSAAPDRLRVRPSAYLTIDPLLLGRADPDACLVARAGDDGMNSDGVRKGDFVVVEETDAVKSGEMALFLVGESLVVRRHHLANERLHLRPADRRYTEETYVPGDPRCHVVGRVLAVVRKVA